MEMQNARASATVRQQRSTLEMDPEPCSISADRPGTSARRVGVEHGTMSKDVAAGKRICLHEYTRMDVISCFDRCRRNDLGTSGSRTTRFSGSNMVRKWNATRKLKRVSLLLGNVKTDIRKVKRDRYAMFTIHVLTERKIWNFPYSSTGSLFFFYCVAGIAGFIEQ